MDAQLQFTLSWQSHLLQSLSAGTCHPTPFSACAKFHYDQLQLDSIVKDYLGNLDGFLQFLSSSWGWIIRYAEDGQTLLVDENKDECVCPVAKSMQQAGCDAAPTLCCCSEQFAKLMFSRVVGREVQAKVVRSVIRDGKSCIYEIKL